MSTRSNTRYRAITCPNKTSTPLELDSQLRKLLAHLRVFGCLVTLASSLQKILLLLEKNLLDLEIHEMSHVHDMV